METNEMIERGAPSRCRGESGAVIAEFALVSPFLVLLVLGIVEYGTIFRNETTITGAVRNAARADAQVQNTAGGDRNALQSLWASIGSAQSITVNRVIVYKSTTTSGAPPSSCVTASMSNSGGGVVNSCNVYNLYQLQNAGTGTFSTSTAACGSGSGWDRYWCPSGRNARLSGAGSPPDHLGVYINVTYTSLTGILPTGNTMTITDYAVNRIEPSI